MTMNIFALHVPVHLLSYLISVHWLFEQPKEGCRTAWRRLTQFKAAHLKQITFWEEETILWLSQRSDTTLSNVSPLNSTAKCLKVSILSHWMFHEEWYLHWNHWIFVLCCEEIPSEFSVSFPLILCQIVSVSQEWQIRAAKSQSVAGQVK